MSDSKTAPSVGVVLLLLVLVYLRRSHSVVGKGKELRCWQRVNKKAGLCALAQLVGCAARPFRMTLTH